MLLYLFLAVLGLRCFVWTFSSCREQGLLFIVVSFLSLCCLLLGSMGSRCSSFSSCGSWALDHGLRNFGTQALLLCNMWSLPRLEIQRLSPALAGGFLPTMPPGKSAKLIFKVEEFFLILFIFFII